MRTFFTILLALISQNMYAQLYRVKKVELTEKEYQDTRIAQPRISLFEEVDTLDAGDLKLEIYGSLNESDTFLLMRSIPDSLNYILLRPSDKVERVVGYPFFSSSRQSFAVLLSSPHYGHEIMIYKIVDHEISVWLSFAIFEKNPEIGCLTDKSFTIRDAEGHFWKYEFNEDKTKVPK